MAGNGVEFIPFKGYVCQNFPKKPWQWLKPVVQDVMLRQINDLHNARPLHTDLQLLYCGFM